MGKALEFTDHNFEKEVLRADGPVLVDFWAAWCGPCRAVGPTIDSLAEEYQGRVKVGKFDIDANPEIAGQIGIQSIPAVLLFRDGKVVDRLIGVKPKEAYDEVLTRLAA